jgi:hypothetical protein
LESTSTRLRPFGPREVVERDHEIQDPASAEKIRLLGEYLRDLHHRGGLIEIQSVWATAPDRKGGDHTAPPVR